MKWQVTLSPYWVRLLKQVNRLVINKAKTWDTTVLASPTFVYKCLFFNAFCHISFDRQKHLTLTKFSSYILYFVYRGDRPRGWNNACYLPDISSPMCQSRLGPWTDESRRSWKTRHLGKNELNELSETVRFYLLFICLLNCSDYWLYCIIFFFFFLPFSHVRTGRAYRSLRSQLNYLILE